MSRYSRQIALPQVGPEGQQKLAAARVLIVGLGGLGAPVALYLAAAGVGTLLLCDGDAVDASNLQRQVLFGENDVGQPKVTSAVAALKRLNSEIDIVPLANFVDAENVNSLVSNCDIVVDCTDNLPVRYLLNDACLAHGKPLVYGALHRFEGQVSVFCLPGAPCFRCYFPNEASAENAVTCQEAGVFGVLPGIVGSLQANEVLKLILRLGTYPDSSKSSSPISKSSARSCQILIFDAITMNFDKLKLQRRPDCLCQNASLTSSEFADTSRAAAGPISSSSSSGIALI